MTPFRDYKPRAEQLLDIPGWRLALYVLAGYVLACLAGGMQ